MWIWEQPDWPLLTYDEKTLIPYLERCIQHVAPLKALAATLEFEQRLDWESAILLDETLATARIEGELLDRESVRSSIANKLGIGCASRLDRHVDGLVEVLLQAIRFSNQLLTHDQLKTWHQMIFPVAPLLGKLTIGDYRDEAVQVQSGRHGKETIHFVAPAEQRKQVWQEMERFLQWLNHAHIDSAYVRAALAKFYFVTIHPFEDGNGRLSRIIAERCLAQAEQTTLRLYSLSSRIELHRAAYYNILERCQSGNGDVTEWICWFLEVLAEAASEGRLQFQRLVGRTRFWQQHQAVVFNERQLKLLKRMLEKADFVDGISRQKYRHLTHSSDATAARDLVDLVEKGLLVALGEGRGRRYQLLINE